jgi:hypothetical protein
MGDNNLSYTNNIRNGSSSLSMIELSYDGWN